MREAIPINHHLRRHSFRIHAAGVPRGHGLLVLLERRHDRIRDVVLRPRVADQLLACARTFDDFARRKLLDEKTSKDRRGVVVLTALRELESRQLPRREVPRVAVVHEQPPVRRWGALVSVANLHLRPRRVRHIRRPSVEYPRVLQPDVALLEGVAHGLLEERRDVRLLLLDDVVESTVEQQPVVIFVQIESVLSTRQKPASESTEICWEE